MKFLNSIQGKKKAFSLVEVLTVLFVFSLITTTFYQFFSSGTRLMTESKHRLAALNVASEKLESIRGMEYGLVGTVGGTPEGIIEQNEYENVGQYQFHIVNSIYYMDDPDDGIEGGSPNDDTPNDYKMVNVSVYWGGETGRQMVSISSRVIPFGTEASVTGGTLQVSLMDVDGNPVSGASVHVVNSTVSPVINFTEVTGDSGTVSRPGSPASDREYDITVSKSGYETVETQSPYPETDYYPEDEHASVVEGAFSNAVVKISRLSNLEMAFVDPLGDPVDGLEFDLSGGRNMGTYPDGTVLYNYNNSLISDENGTYTVNDLSPGNYTVNVTSTDHTLWRTSPVTGNEVNEILLPQGALPHHQDIIVMDNAIDSYFVRVVDAVTGVPIEGASVDLSNDLLLYDATVVTDLYGYAFFPTGGDDNGDGIDDVSLVSGESYDVDVTAIGYTGESSTVTISGLTSENINMSPL